MSARRSSSDPVSVHLQRGERIVWRTQPSPRALFFNRLPQLIIIAGFIAFVAAVTWPMLSGVPADLRTGGALGSWLIIPLATVVFAGVILATLLRIGWRTLGALNDSWSTHYALTDRRLLVVSARGLIAYGPEVFAKMEPLGGARGAQVLLFDWGPMGRKRRDAYRDRLAALDSAAELARLIRETLKPPAPPLA